jgi:nitroreductase
MDVNVALRARISTRAFLPRPVSKELLTAVLDDARWSPSGGNLQPWKVVAVAGSARQAVIDAVNAAAAQDPSSQEGDHPMYPAELWEPLRTRRYQLGEQMYEQLGIPRDDKAARFARLMENFNFFGAPVGLFFITDDRMGAGQWAHLGMFMQSLALAAVEHGLATCMQEAWAMRRATLKEHFALDAHDYVYCGMSLGYADPDQAVNRLRSERVSVDEFTTWHGWT